MITDFDDNNPIVLLSFYRLHYAIFNSSISTNALFTFVYSPWCIGDV